ncbi:MAG: phosphoglycerate kinase [Coriobacteriales bacterium]|jgi:phosphoglycerate kinase|nr:phosphoglycerate kinase [Coriobacteriales bacterium]
MKTIDDITDIDGKRVLVRVDFNVPLENGTVSDDTRIRAALPTIKSLTDGGARVILMSHLGRPSGTGFEDAYSLGPAARVLARLLANDVALASYDDATGGLVCDDARSKANGMEPGQVILLENLRFDAREKKNDEGFAKELASLADIYVDDAFGVAHRAHASVEAIAHILPSYAGLLLSNEVETLTSMLAHPERPFVAILGGSKVSDKIKVIDSLLDTVDVLLIGGAMCFTFLAAQGYSVGKSLCETDWIDKAKAMLDKAYENGVAMLLPNDVVVADGIDDVAGAHVCGIDEIPSDKMGLDVGPATCERYAHEIASAKTVFWNGPMGVFEVPAFEAGTKQVALAVARNKQANTVIGGGDSVAAIHKFDLANEVTFISTGGGASMQLVEGTPLPGVVALG